MLIKLNLLAIHQKLMDTVCSTVIVTQTYPSAVMSPLQDLICGYTMILQTSTTMSSFSTHSYRCLFLLSFFLLFFKFSSYFLPFLQFLCYSFFFLLFPLKPLLLSHSLQIFQSQVWLRTLLLSFNHTDVN